jgi:hypothetical protein
MGVIGRLLGSSEHKPGSLVVLVLVLSFIMMIVMFLIHDTEPYRRDIIASLFSLITLSLGYYFGKRGGE